MGHLDTAALAVDFGRGVRAIELYVPEPRTRCEEKRALAPMLFEPRHDVLIQPRQAPGKVELAGLDHRPGGGSEIPPALQLHRVKEGAVGDVIVLMNLVERHVPRLKV